MKTYLTVLLTFLMAFSFVNAEGQKYSIRSSFRSGFKPRIDCGDNVKIWVDHGTVVIEYKDHYNETVEITKENVLIVDDIQIEMNLVQKELTKEYYDLVIKVFQDVKEIGYEGAKVGADGAKIGLKAVAGVFKLILPGYGSDDLERDLENEAEKLEAKAEKLEYKAEKIELLFEDLQDVQDRLRYQVSELQELGWF